ncbi:MAG: ADP-ribosylglycohydrolase family protein [Clostridia bacterium]|nr:ADP-ribosylglycohydrolase family protein [Clostridia bacterium]
MILKDEIAKLRLSMKMSQREFAENLGVTQQSVCKWEAGTAVPDVEKLAVISKKFGISIDALVLGTSERTKDEMYANKFLKPNYANFMKWEAYEENLTIEYKQCLEEGLDIERYKDLFEIVEKMPKGEEEKKRIGDVLFDLVTRLPKRQGYRFVEPSDLDGIMSLRPQFDYGKKALPDDLKDRVSGAITGRACGCLLGKTVEGIKYSELTHFLKKTGNYPMKRYIFRSDLTPGILSDYNFPFEKKVYADECDGMPVDDDINYVVIAHLTVERYGENFTPYDMSRSWLALQGKDAYCTAERLAFINFVNGYEPPYSAVYKNPFREWIGAQIRGDYFGYIHAGNPEAAARTAYNDACISHVKNGIYGEMFASAMIAYAAVEKDIKKIITGGLGQIPSTSRLYKAIFDVIDDYEKGVGAMDEIGKIHAEFDDADGHDWCHTISNAKIVATALLYGGGDFGKSVCLAVQTGFDTDCNGATVGSVLGMRNGLKSIGEEWTKPINGKLKTSIFGFEEVKIESLTESVLNRINQRK